MRIVIDEDTLVRIATYADLSLTALRRIVQHTYVLPGTDVRAWSRGSLIAATIREHERHRKETE